MPVIQELSDSNALLHLPSMDKPLVLGRVVNEERYDRERVPPVSFITTTVPAVYNDTFIVAATHPNVRGGHPNRDGWFLSDFYAFNYLLKGLGFSQVWLTAAVRALQEP